MKLHPKKTLGIVSGIGPLAGADTLNKLFANAAKLYGAVQDDEYPDTILISRGISGVDNTGALSNYFRDELIRIVDRIETAGASVIGIACNTAHIYLPDIAVKPETILINLPEVVAKVAENTGEQHHLLLTSSASREVKLYDNSLQARGVSYDLASDDIQNKLDIIIELIMAYKLDEAGSIMSDILEHAKSAGYHSIIAACTELPIAIDNCGDTYGLNIIDSSSELGKELLRICYA